MNHFLAILIQLALIFVPPILYWFAMAHVPSKALRLAAAGLVAIATGGLAWWAGIALGWKPVGKGSRVLDLSPGALFWAFSGAMGVVLCLFAFSKSGRPAAASPGTWRVGHRGRDQMIYEEFRDGTWQTIEIDGEMLLGPAHHVIYFASPEEWDRKYPAWAHNRRVEIIGRIKSAFAPPDYEYHGG